MRLTVKRYTYLLLLLWGLLVVACRQSPIDVSSVEDPWGVIEIERNQPIRIAVATATTGPGGIVREGIDQLHGAELAIQQHGPIKDFEIELVAFDSQCSDAGGSRVALSIISDPSIVAVIGHTCSTSCAASVTLYDTVQYTNISPSCSASELIDQTMHTGSFARTIYDDSLEANASAQFAYLELGIRRAAVIHDSTPDTTHLASAFRIAFTDLGGEIVAMEIISPGDENYSNILERIEDTSPDLIYAPLLPADATVLVMSRDENQSTTPLLGGRHYWSTWFVNHTSERAEGIYASGPIFTNAAYRAFNESFEQQYGEASTNFAHAYAYDAVNLLVRAIEGVSVITPSGNLEIGRQALHNEIYSTWLYQGVTGSITCTSWGECSTEAIAIGQVKNGRWITVYIP